MCKRCGILIVLLLLLFTPMACKNAKVRPYVTDDGIGVAVIMDERAAERFESNVSRFERNVGIAADVLDGIAKAAKAIEVISEDEDIDRGARGVGDAAEKGSAGAMLLLTLAGIARNLTKKEDI